MKNSSDLSLNLSRKKAILQYIRNRGRASAFEIAKAMKLPTMSSKLLVDDLAKIGIVKKVGLGASTGGRPPILLEIQSDFAYMVGIDIDPRFVEGVIVDIGDNIIVEKRLPINKTDTKQEIIDVIISAIDFLLDNCNIDKGKIKGIGVVSTGFVDFNVGRVVSSLGLPNWKDVHIKDILEYRYSMPIFLDDTVTAYTMAEKWNGGGREIDDFLLLKIRSTIGLGVVINGDLYRGQGHAGFVNHLKVTKGGPKCVCGQRGCLFATASGSAIVERAVSKFDSARDWQLYQECNGDPGRVTFERVIEKAIAGDPYCEKIIDDQLKYIGIALARLSELFHPQKIIIGGSLVVGRDVFLETIRRSCDRIIFPELKGQTAIEFSSLGPETGAIGAATLVLNEVFESAKQPVAKT